MIPNVLSIAGFDPSGGAGIAADLKSFAALKCHGMAAVTALTAQNTQGVRAVHLPPADFVAAQIDAIFDDIEVAAVKIGMLASPQIVEAVAERLAHYKPRFVVLDPVLETTSGDALAAPGTAEAILKHLLPLVTLVTPNIFEAARLSGQAVAGDFDGMRRAATALHGRGAKAALVKGGHIAGPTSDDLFFDGKSFRLFSAPRVEARNTHGTGCTLSSAIAAYIARDHMLEEAVGAAKTYLNGALAAAGALSAGKGPGPLHHFHDFWTSDDSPARLSKPHHLV
jgi:hydroxymethylpyrimidine/phosphomethylpyrimidine kinase